MKTMNQSERRELRETRAAERDWEDEGGSVKAEGEGTAEPLVGKVRVSAGKPTGDQELETRDRA
ncbi:MAG: hypothetical protein HY329_22370 [Chloroflexi bacterium]|nr:hypothetical protein [Chloroflexota bacterium]